MKVNIPMLTTSQLDPSDTYYTGACNRGNTSEGQQQKQPSSCYCPQEAAEQCGDGIDLASCSYLNINETDVTSRLASQALFPLKCLKLPYEYKTFPLFQYNSTYNPGVIDISQPSPTGTSFSDYRSQCQFNLASDVSPYDLVKKCRDVFGVRMENVISSCALDLYMSYDFSWIKAGVQSIKVQCQLQLERNSSWWEGNPPTLPQDYTDVLCLANCGGAGKCSKGVCLCQANYGGSDCFVNVILLTNASGTYDIDGSLKRSNATFLTVNELSCPIPESGTYQVQISNNKNVFSSSAYLFVYDSLCFECNVKNQTCIQKKTACLIDGVCYENREYNPSSAWQYCDPSVNTSSWQTANDSCQGLELLWLEHEGHLSGGELPGAGDKEACKRRCLNMFRDGTGQCYSIDFNSTSSSCSYHTLDERITADNLIRDNQVSNLEWICENNPCGRKNLTWIRRPGFAIITTGGRQIMGIRSSVECRKLCLQEKSFLCRSAQLLWAASLCVLSPKTSLIAGQDFVRWPGYIFEEWICDTDNEPLLPVANPLASIKQAPNAGADDYTLMCEFEIAPINSSLQANIMWLINDMVVDESTVWTIVLWDKAV
ncbi:unnamed protein product [Candidula unifasciata]|uniref:EGF-like domain-containing protein n=1 Tax=Candidula unifasciata TaxID=100452 RepID=A0A8S3YYZ7_9EUPU|nr:unnamed protein product [Candidula unifasciata]